MDRKTHWETVYATKRSDEVSWYQQVPVRSIELIEKARFVADAAVVDVGGGDSTLVDALLDRGYRMPTILDISGAALERARKRLGARAALATWIEADITRAEPPAAAYDVWHDRAVFHFLTRAEDRAGYAHHAARAVRPGGIVIIATYAPHGPTKCSGIDVMRYDGQGLAAALGAPFHLEHSFEDVHRTPTGNELPFTYAVLRRLSAAP